MKKLIFALITALALSVFGAETASKPVFECRFDSLKPFYLSVNRKKGADAKMELVKVKLNGKEVPAAKVTVLKRGSLFADIQFMLWSAPFKLVAGEKYRLELRMMTSKPVEFSITIFCQDSKGHVTRPSSEGSMRYSSAGNLWEDKTFEFYVEEEYSGDHNFRIPNFFLGDFPPGSEFYCSRIALYHLK